MDSALEVAGALRSYAEAAEDVELASEIDFSRSSLVEGSSVAVIARCKVIVDTATEHLEALGDYGVTAAKLNALKQAVKSFDGLRTWPRQSKTTRSAATKQLGRVFPKIDRLLRNRIDKLMVQFKTTKPAFYDRYRAARVIVETGARSGKIVEIGSPAGAETAKAA